MKTSIKLAMTLGFIVLTTAMFAQKDTTEIIVGNKKIIVIEKKGVAERSLGNLGTGINTFKIEIENATKRIEELQSDIENLRTNSYDSTGIATEERIEMKENEIEENEKRISAFEKGIEDLERAMDELEAELEKLEDIEIPEVGDEEDELEIEHDSGDDNDCDEDECNRKKEYNGHFAGLEFGLANFTNVNFGLPTKSELNFMELTSERSFAFSLNFMEFNIPISKKYFGLTTGMSLNWSSYALAQNIDLEENSITGAMEGVLIPTDVRDYKVNNFNNAYFTIPLIAEVQIPAGKHRFYLGGGVTGSIRGWSKQKQVYYINNQKYKDKFVNDYQLSPFRYGLTARVGYGPIGLFADYSLVPLFKDAMGPELYPINVGIRFINF